MLTFRRALKSLKGIGGPTEDTGNQQYWLRKAQEAPAALPEFRGKLLVVSTEHYWDSPMPPTITSVLPTPTAKIQEPLRFSIFVGYGRSRLWGTCRGGGSWVHRCQGWWH